MWKYKDIINAYMDLIFVPLFLILLSNFEIMVLSMHRETVWILSESGLRFKANFVITFINLE